MMEKQKRELTFLSYAHDDLDRVRKVYEGLKKRNVSVWFDKVDLGPGKWKPQIEKKIPKCRYFIFCLSEATVKKTEDDAGFVEEELQAAWKIAEVQDEKSFTIIPVRLEDCGHGDHRVSTFQQYDLFADFEKELDRLAVKIGGISLSDSKARDERTEDEKLIESLFGKASVAYYSGEYNKALSMFDAVINIDPGNHKVWKSKELIHAILGKQEEAISAFDKGSAIKLDDNNTNLDKVQILYNSGRSSMVDYRKKLNEMRVRKLREIAMRINIPDRIKLKRRKELINAILQYPEEEIKKNLGINWSQKIKKPVFYIGLFGAIASILALILSLWDFCSSQNSIQTFKEDSAFIKMNAIAINNRLKSLERALEKKIDEPAVQKVKEEYEKKLAGMEKTLMNLKKEDKKGSDKALKAFREGDYSKARKFFEDIRKKEKEIEKKHAITAYNLAEIAFLELDFKGALDYYLESEILDPDNTLFQNKIGFVYLTLGKLNDAKEYYEKALRNDIRRYGNAHPYVARDWNNIGMVWSSMGQYKKAIDYFEKALSSELKSSAKRHKKVAIIWNNLGNAWQELGKYEQAKGYFEKALSSDLKTYGSEHPKVAIRWNNMGIICHAQGKYKQAKEYFEKALKSALKTYGREHPQVSKYWNNLGLVWHSLGNFKKAMGYYEKALSSDLKSFGREHPSVAKSWNNIGMVWYSKGKYEKAIEYYEKAISSDLKTYGPEHPQVAKFWNNLGCAWDSLGKHEKAIFYLNQALASDIKTYGSEHVSVARDWNNLGSTFYSQGQYEIAFSYYEKALKIREVLLGKDHPKTKETKNNLEISRKKLQ